MFLFTFFDDVVILVLRLTFYLMKFYCCLRKWVNYKIIDKYVVDKN